MSEIAQMFESALRQNRANLLRKAAMNTVARMPPATTLRELLESDAGDAVRELSIRELTEALGEGRTSGRPSRRRVMEADHPQVWPESREEQIYRRILDALQQEPKTIGQLGKTLDLEIDELRGYLGWMKKKGKVMTSGRARATRYQVSR